MKIAFLTTIVFPSRMANRIHIINMCKALLQLGHSVDLFSRSFREGNFGHHEKMAFINISRRSGIYAGMKYVQLLKKNKYDLWYVREPRLLFWVLLWRLVFRVPKVQIIYEVHDMPRNWIDVVVFTLLRKYRKYKVVAITNLLKTDISENYKIPLENIIWLPDGVDLEMFKATITKAEARVKLGFSPEGKYVVYTGNLFAWKGVYTLCEAAKLTPEITYVIVGGKEEDLAALTAYAKDIKNVMLCGYKPQTEIPSYLYAADVLVLPNSAKYTMSEKYTSPLKLFEYMAAGRPIVASNLPSIREIIRDGENGFLVTEDSTKALVDGIRAAIESGRSEAVTSRAKEESGQYSWYTRCERLLDFVPTS